jgi:hypothetical protein
VGSSIFVDKQGVKAWRPLHSPVQANPAAK